MSDMLDKLIHTEKSASEMVSSAETEANRRKTETRAAAQKEHALVLKQKAAEVESEAEAEKERAAKERKDKNQEFRSRLADHGEDRSGFFRLLAELIEKGEK